MPGGVVIPVPFAACGHWRAGVSATINVMNESLQQHLDSLARDECYRVDSVLKEGRYERTERVFFVGANGAEQGPYVRKVFEAESGLGGAYGRVLAAQRQGKRFLHLPRIVDCYSLGEHDAVVMEFVTGRTLADEIYETGPSLDVAKRLFSGICDAVGELHGRFDPPLIHRDIKPSNFMVDGDTVLVIDLGIARTFDKEAVCDTSHFGTRAYAPPEQFGYGQTDVRSDVYALGMLLFYLLCEETPVPSTAQQRLRAHGVPESVRDVVAQATAFDPVDRFGSVAAMRAAFMYAVGSPVDFRWKTAAAEAYYAQGAGDIRSGGSACGADGVQGAGDLRRGVLAAEAGYTQDSGSNPGFDMDGGSRPFNALHVSDSDCACATPYAVEPALSAILPITSVSGGAKERGRFKAFVHGARAALRWLWEFSSGIARRLPLGVGVAWDVLLAAWGAVMVFACVASCMNPQGDMARLPAFACVVGYVCIWLVMGWPIPLLVDTRPLERLFDWFERPTLKQRAIVAAGMVGAAFAVLTLIGILFLRES